MLLTKQNNKCAICNEFLETSTERAYVDHCHKTNIVRGIVHPKCNTFVGFIESDRDGILLKQIYSYIEKWSKQTK